MATVMGGVGYGMYYVAKVRHEQTFVWRRTLTPDLALYHSVDCPADTAAIAAR